MKEKEIYLKVKTVTDSVGAAACLLMLWPILIIVGICIYLDDPGPIIYRQQRAGRQHLPFTIYKFRSMLTSTPSLSTAELQAQKISNVTKVGRIIRLTSLDELPQLFNILKGDMSFIGPRPALMTQIDVLKNREKYGIQILKPGLSGLAQVKGRDDLTLEQKIAYDRKYMENISPAYDISLIARTLQAVLFGRGAN